MSIRFRSAIYGIVWLLCLTPLIVIVYWGLSDQLGANPINTGIRALGDWGVRFLVVSLAIRPLRDWFGWRWIMGYRRTIGLFGFAYIACHLSAYVGLDQFFDWPAIWADIVKRPYITFGMLAFTLLVPLAVTSTNGMIRRLGPMRWRRLHKLIYVIVPLGILHYDLLVKKDATWPHIYAAIAALLLLYRAMPRRKAQPTLARPIGQATPVPPRPQ